MLPARRKVERRRQEMKAKEMLAEVLRRATLTERERESFTDMWDRIHRYDRCSPAQKAWIEKVYFGQKLDKTVGSPVAKRRVVIPSWQKTQLNHEASRSVVLQPSPVPALAPQNEVEGPRLVKVSSRDIRARRPSSRSGTFSAVTAPVRPSLPSNGARVGYINYPGVQRDTLVTDLSNFEQVCPRIEPGSKQHQLVAQFFAGGGVVLRVKPLSEPRVA